MASKFDPIIKENIAEIRRLKKISQGEMAVRLKIDRNTYRNIEAGKTFMVNEKLDEIAVILDVSPEELILGYNPLDLNSDPRLEEFKRTYGDKKEREAMDYLIEKAKLLAVIEDLKEKNQLLQTSVDDKSEIIKYLKSRKND